MTTRWPASVILAAILTVLAMLVALAFCGGPAEGVVKDRRYHGPWTEMRSSCIATNSNGSCTGRMYQSVYHPESCALRLRNGDDEGWTEVPCAGFDQYAVGDYYPKGR